MGKFIKGRYIENDRITEQEIIDNLETVQQLEDEANSTVVSTVIETVEQLAINQTQICNDIDEIDKDLSTLDYELSSLHNRINNSYKLLMAIGIIQAITIVALFVIML